MDLYNYPSIEDNINMNIIITFSISVCTQVCFVLLLQKLFLCVRVQFNKHNYITIKSQFTQRGGFMHMVFSFISAQRIHQVQ